MAIDAFLNFGNSGTPSALQTDVTTLLHDIGTNQTPSQIPIGTPISLLFIGAALVFLPKLFDVGGNQLFGVGNLGGSSNQTTLGTIEHDFQHLVTDIVGILHPSTGDGTSLIV
jgi:hypothetical protein